jgi:CheY-like chemotaxis protein
MHTPTPEPARSPPVLLVEEDVRLAREGAWFLGRSGLEVHTLHRGELAARAANDADIVVLDRMLPGLDGLEECRALRAAHHLPLRMLTAREEDASESRAPDERTDDDQCKPVRLADSLVRMRRKPGDAECAPRLLKTARRMPISSAFWGSTASPPVSPPRSTHSHSPTTGADPGPRGQGSRGSTTALRCPSRSL